MRISNNLRSVKPCRKRVCAVTCMFMLLLDVTTVVYAQNINFDRSRQHETRFWNSLSLRIQDARAISANSKQVKYPQDAHRFAEKSTAKTVNLLVVHRTKKLTRAGGKPRLVTVAKAMLNIDGERRVLEQGQSSPEGVTLVSADSDQAVVEINGQRETLTLSMAAVFPGSVDAEETEDSDDKNVSLWEGPGGFFYADGAIEDYPVHFLLDTGANTIAISSGLARRIGLNYEGKQQKIAKTVGGTVAMVPIILKSVSVGHITLHDVLAGIFEGPESDAALLGMSFLGQVDMVRTGKQMELKVR